MRLCVSVLEPTIERAAASVRAAIDAGAFAEVRLDAIAGCERLTVEALEPLCHPTSLVTFRRPRDGGRREVDERWRVDLVARTAARFGVRCDLEAEHAGAIAAHGLDPERVVLSHHDFTGTPDALVDLFDRIAREPGVVVKLATATTSVADVFAHFDVLRRARSLGRRAVSIAMGQMGLATRILGPAWGSEFTFCALETGRESAPGQVSFAEMRDLYRVDHLTRETVITGLIGGKVGYSRSPAMHNRAAAELGIDMVYVPFEVDDLAEFLTRIRESNWPVRGLSVTNPFKIEVVRFLDWVDAVAERAGAVNTIVFDGDVLRGYNTDVEGAIAPLEALVGSLAGLRVGVLGAGGAARALASGLAARRVECCLFARDVERARAVAEPLGVEGRGIRAFCDARLDVVVNATPVGTAGIAEDESPIPASWLEGVGVAYDLVYAPERTRFLADAERAGCRTLGGLPMLATQAALQFELWTGRSISPSRMLRFSR